MNPRPLPALGLLVLTAALAACGTRAGGPSTGTLPVNPVVAVTAPVTAEPSPGKGQARDEAPPATFARPRSGAALPDGFVPLPASSAPLFAGRPREGPGTW